MKNYPMIPVTIDSGALYFEYNLFQEAVQTLNCFKSESVFPIRNYAYLINPFQDRKQYPYWLM